MNEPLPQAAALPATIALFGECMIELNGELFGHLKQTWGGDTYNTAIYLRRLLPSEFCVHYLTGLGDDLHSTHMKRAWSNQGLETSEIMTVAGKRPGLYQISVDDTGERSFCYWRNDAAVKYVFDQTDATTLARSFAKFDWFYLSGISLAVLTPLGRCSLINALKLYVRSGGQLIFDNNYRPSLWSDVQQCREVYRKILSITRIALLTLDDEKLLWQSAGSADVMAMWPCPELVIKCGAEACWVRQGSHVFKVPSRPVAKVVDTTAAGDSFAAGYLASRLLGEGLETAARQGHLLASTVIQHQGAIIPASAMPIFC